MVTNKGIMTPAILVYEIKKGKTFKKFKSLPKSLKVQILVQ